MTRKDYIVKYLCDKQHTLTRTTKKYFISYKKYNDFVLKVTKDETFTEIKREKISEINAIKQLIHNFKQLY